MPWLLLALGALLVWMGFDALRVLGPIRPLGDREVDRAVLGPGNKGLSKWGRNYAGRWLPAHNSLESLLAWLFLLSGLICLAFGVWELILS